MTNYSGIKSNKNIIYLVNLNIYKQQYYLSVYNMFITVVAHALYDQRLHECASELCPLRII